MSHRLTMLVGWCVGRPCAFVLMPNDHKHTGQHLSSRGAISTALSDCPSPAVTVRSPSKHNIDVAHVIMQLVDRALITASDVVKTQAPKTKIHDQMCRNTNQNNF